MKKNFMYVGVAAMALFLTACSGEAEAENEGGNAENVESNEGGGDDNAAELTRLSDERDHYFQLKTDAAGEMDMDKMKMYEAKMDSVDALYQELLRQ